MSIVGLLLADGRPVYVNPAEVRRLAEYQLDGSDLPYTNVIFSADDSVVVAGDLDNVAFQLFADKVR